MEQNIQAIIDLITGNSNLSAEEKAALITKLKETDKKINITEFKLERTEKIKRTTAILLEETIEELDHKRKAVEAQNKELEIESSLERVRTVALSMNKPDDMLQVCRVISEQLQRLNVQEIRNVQTAIFYETKGTYTNYEFYTRHDKLLVTEVDYKDHPVGKAFADQMIKGPNEIFMHGFKGTEVQDWYEYQKTTNVFIDTFLKTAHSLNYYWYSLGPVALGLSTYHPLSEEAINLFKRFVKVFELSYRRYLDIEKAEAQVKEAKIEASLERMRVAAMSMRKSEELITVCEAMYKELTVLGFANIRNAQIAIKNDTKQSYLVCEYSDYNVTIMQEAPYDSSPIVRELYRELEKSNDALYQKEFSGKEFDDWRAWRESISASTDSRIAGASSMCFYLYSIGTGHLGISTFNAITNEQVEILKRFRNVFELSYRRYIDVARAEAQAREAQIELALERVRAKTMAMQRSEELAETSFVLFQQFKDLGETSEQISIGIFNEGEHVMELYSTLYGSQWKEAAKVDLDEPVVMKKIYAAWKEENKSLVIDISDNDLLEYNAYRKKISNLEYREDRWVIHIAFFSKGALTFSTTEPYPHETIQLLERFAGVFDGTYTRFLDLQKAEAQARESQIQLALERVRARTMAMQRSDELQDVALLLFQQVKDLGITAWATGFNIWNVDNRSYIDWMTGPTGEFMEPYTVDLTSHQIFRAISEARQNGEDFHVFDLRGEGLAETYKLLESFITKNEFKKFLESGSQVPVRQINHYVFGAEVSLLFITYEPVPEAHDIFKRFGKTFEQTYTRFLDLQKAEAQVREAKIEAALERTRTQSMLMQHSKELDDTLRVFHEQVSLLGINSAFSFLWLPDEKNDRHIFWAAWGEDKNGSTVFKSKAINYLLDRNEPATAQCLVDWKSNEPVYSYHVPPAAVENYFAVWQELIDGVDQLKPEHFSGGLHCVEAFMKYGCFGVMVANDLTEDEKKILSRFAIEFERTYTRFLDLQKAEAQAREAQIEAALERVRSRSMGMHKSEELSEVSHVINLQFQQLNFQNYIAGFLLDYQDSDDFSICRSDASGLLLEKAIIPYFDHPIFNTFKQAKETGLDFYTTCLSSEEKNKWVDHALPRFREAPPEVKTVLYNSPGYASSCALLKNVGLFIENFNGIPFSKEENAILMRFAKVFEQTYTRFNDLKHAESQAREAQIEAALERVRSRSMAMQKSEELKEVIQVVYEQFVHLNIHVEHTGFIMDYKERDDMHIWLADYHSVPSQVTIPYFDSPHWNSFNEAKEKGIDFFANHLAFEEKNRFYQELFNHIPGVPEETREYYFSCPGLAVSTVLLENIGLYIENYSGIAYSDEENATLMRFGKVFQQTYTRFLDLQKAEAQAKEATKQASLDRVRGQIASMRSTEDLQRITPLIWRELTMLDVPFIRCGVLIIDETKAEAHIYLSSPEGQSLAAMNLPLQSNTLTSNSVEYWRKGLVYTEHWDREDFVRWMQSMIQQGQVQDPETYQGAAKPPDSLHLHFVPFTQGMLYVGNIILLTNDEIDLVKSLAEAFSIAYARYEDFTKLEKAKQSIEVTLTELRATQTQLIQSEKMASLGELTAGIAHEIQNPLNFVNNFSELNKELLEELADEIDKKNFEEVKIIAKDIIGNEEKISHHGKRADAIVKGMLQHSRSSSGQKEPTDINALADEYLRLAYHGLRAKDKSFNATMKTDYDETLKEVNIIPQDIGRVILNLIMNAFYAVHEKAKDPLLLLVAGSKEYEPTVTVSTKSVKPPPTGRGLGVSISVKDNGNGIPQKAFDKIFQPFFTTKPTGQGTGLGLSLSYDIMKAHGGEIKVETTEGRGTEFIILLPVV